MQVWTIGESAMGDEPMVLGEKERKTKRKKNGG